MEVSASYYRHLLKGKLAELCRKNSNYSLRSFAKKLEISPSTLSRVLSGQCALSIKSAEKIATTLAKNEDEHKFFMDSALEDYRQRQASTPEANHRPDPMQVDLLSTEKMSPALALLCFTVLELTFTEDFSPDPQVIAERTGYPESQVKQAVKTLIQTGLLKKSKNTLEKTQKSIHLKAKEGYDSHLGNLHQELFKFASDRMPTHDPTTSAVVTLTLPSDPEKIALARSLIEDFSWQLCRTLTSGRMTEIYHLGIFLEPATKKLGDH